jgi:hypothetical protein
MALTTKGEQKKTYKGKNFDKSKVTCHRCGKKGHYAPECDQKRQTAKNLLMSGVASEFENSNHVKFQVQQQHSYFELSESSRIPSSWILLDNQPTVNISSMKTCWTTSVMEMASWPSTATREPQAQT